MGIIFDICLLAIIALIIFINYKKGCLSLLSFFAPVIAFFSAYSFGAAAGMKFFYNGLLTKVAGAVESGLEKYVGEWLGNTVNSLTDSIPKAIEGLLTRVISIEALEEKILGSADFDLSGIALKVAEPVAKYIAQALGCIAVFVAVYLLVLILKLVLRLFLRIPVLKKANQFFGILLGIINAFVFTWLICILVSVFAEFSLLGEYNEIFYTISQKSFLSRFFCNLSVRDLINHLPI